MRARISCIIPTLLLISMGCFAQEAEPPVQASNRDQEVHHILSSVDEYSLWRFVIGNGVVGDGIHRAYMDRMRAEGIKFSELTLEFSWHDHSAKPEDWKIVEEMYCSDYDCYNVLDNSGTSRELREELANDALQQAPHRHWFEGPESPQGTGYALFMYADNEWFPLPHLTQLGPYPDGETPLMRAAMLGNITRTKALLKNGEDINRALISAAHLQFPGEINLLLSAGANPNVEFHAGVTALSVAVQSGLPKNVEILLKAGASPNIRNAKGESLLDLAKRSDFFPAEKIRLLTTAGAR